MLALYAGTPGQYWRTLEEVEAEGSNPVSRNAPSPWVHHLHLFHCPCSCMQLDSLQPVRQHACCVHFIVVVFQALPVSMVVVCGQA